MSDLSVSSSNAPGGRVVQYLYENVNTGKSAKTTSLKGSAGSRWAAEPYFSRKSLNSKNVTAVLSQPLLEDNWAAWSPPANALTGNEAYTQRQLLRGHFRVNSDEDRRSHIIRSGVEVLPYRSSRAEVVEANDLSNFVAEVALIEKTRMNGRSESLAHTDRCPSPDSSSATSLYSTQDLEQLDRTLSSPATSRSSSPTQVIASTLTTAHLDIQAKGIVSAISALGMSTDITAGVTDLLLNLPKRERAMCAFNPSYLKQKVGEAIQIVEMEIAEE